MTAASWLQLALYVAVLLVLAYPLGRYIASMAAGASSSTPSWDPWNR